MDTLGQLVKLACFEFHPSPSLTDSPTPYFLSKLVFLIFFIFFPHRRLRGVMSRNIKMFSRSRGMVVMFLSVSVSVYFDFIGIFFFSISASIYLWVIRAREPSAFITSLTICIARFCKLWIIGFRYRNLSFVLLCCSLLPRPSCPSLHVFVEVSFPATNSVLTRQTLWS